MSIVADESDISSKNPAAGIVFLSQGHAGTLFQFVTKFPTDSVSSSIHCLHVKQSEIVVSEPVFNENITKPLRPLKNKKIQINKGKD
jgi:hypothetical protein